MYNTLSTCNCIYKFNILYIDIHMYTVIKFIYIIYLYMRQFKKIQILCINYIHKYLKIYINLMKNIK